MLKYERTEVYDMYDKELFDKICNVVCSSDELEKFVTKIDKQEFDKENSFDKYYKADRILHAINCYENNEIDDRYLACRMCAYNWIIMASGWAQTNDEVTFKELIVKYQTGLTVCRFFRQRMTFTTLTIINERLNCSIDCI